MMEGDQPRWTSEQEFFDHEAYSEEPIPQDIIDRYVACRHPFTPAEYPFWVLGDVRGKRIFDLGCGDGTNSVLLALKGAHVVAVDISPRAIEIAKNRARLHGVEGRAEFHASPLETYLGQAGGKFDIICGFAILHHLLPVLDSVLDDLKKLAHSQTVYMFTEPVALSAGLRKLRLMLPIPVHGTPDESPLRARDLELILQRLPGAEVRLSHFLLRFWDRFITGRYRDYSPLRRAIYHSLCHLDRGILSIPDLGILGSSSVILSRPAR